MSRLFLKKFIKLEVHIHYFGLYNFIVDGEKLKLGSHLFFSRLTVNGKSYHTILQYYQNNLGGVELVLGFLSLTLRTISLQYKAFKKLNDLILILFTKI